MNTNKILLAGLIGGVVAFFLGFLFYGLLMVDFFASNMGSASGVMRGDDEMQWGPMVVGHLAWGMLFALILGRWAGIKTFSSGLKAGAMIGFLVGVTFDMINLGTTHIMNMTGAMVDIIIMTVVSAIMGGVVGWFLGRGTS